MLRDYAGDVVLAPYPRLSGGIALTSWGCRQLLTELDETAVRAFVEHNRNRYNHGWR